MKKDLNKEELNPWENDLDRESFDYTKYFREFGLREIENSLLFEVNKLIEEKKISGINYFKRKILFAHRDFDKFLDAYKKRKRIAILSGIKPSNDFHLGSKLVADILVFLQKVFDCKIYYCIADLEAIADNNLSESECKSYAISNLTDLLALGIDTKNLYVYFQSREIRVLRKAFLCSTKTTNSTLRAVYGDREIDLFFSAMTQMGDIFLPYEDNYDLVLVPVGIDQDPHIRLARDLAIKLGYDQPCSLYIKFMRGLDGSFKMSKRNRQNILSLSEDVSVVKTKLRNVFTGGRNTAEEQRRLGGEIEKCVFYELCESHFIKEQELLEQMRGDCLSGRILCGECKNRYGKIVTEFFEQHKEKRELNRALAEKMIEKSLSR
ncbi:MAG: tryptophan--tRNA ligase [Candidatus Micrarchaeota archaeon]|nr:tryptophan--tRNA ligase [Candidatus Micrarchaeota archaeon]